MSALLGQIAIAIGGVLFIIVMIVTLSSGMPFLSAAYRAAVVMCISSIVMATFFRFFTSVVYRFITEQLMTPSVNPQENEQDNNIAQLPELQTEGGIDKQATRP